MNEAHIDLTAQDSSQEVADAVDDRLLTRRLPPMTPPPPRVASVPPSSPPPAMAPSGMYPSNSAGTTQPRTSWWHALLTSTFPPPSLAPAVPTDERILKRRVGATCAGMALGFVILALALGLRGAEAAYTPTVTAALVLGRSLVAVGFLAFGYGLLRMAERLITGGTERSGRSSDQG
ncbi:MAG TPA: hypothetical protein VK762_16555 [Polyangiaceae bacterium]|jgi:hypothetical protein|nr:hypothetical protein [Polyangiaceae bacterium]